MDSHKAGRSVMMNPAKYLSPENTRIPQNFRALENILGVFMTNINLGLKKRSMHTLGLMTSVYKA